MSFSTRVIVFTFIISRININSDALSSSKTDLCNDIDRTDIEQYLSSKTPYRVVANLNDEPMKYAGCQPIRIWSVVRHGSRNPSRGVIENIKIQLELLRERILETKDVQLCQKNLISLSKWNFTVSPKEEKYLVAEGEDELIELAERMQKRFPSLLPEIYNPDDYFFKYTNTQRTFKSAQSFATGLFGRHRIGNIIYPEALHRDPILRVSLIHTFYKINE